MKKLQYVKPDFDVVVQTQHLMDYGSMIIDDNNTEGQDGWGDAQSLEVDDVEDSQGGFQ